MKEFAKEIIAVVILIAVLIVSVVVIIKDNNDYNKKQHSDDITITEWISPDGVHYWYQRSGYHAMLAPRYDNNGNLVIDNAEVDKEN